jgi:hypothetical protein
MRGRRLRLVVAAALLLQAVVFQAGLARVGAHSAAGNADICPWTREGYAADDTCWTTNTPLGEDGRFNVNTNSNTWDGSRLDGYAVLDDPAARGGFVQTLWAPRCSPGAQSVRFHLTRILPGVPAEMHLSLGVKTSSGTVNPVTDLALLINGHRVFRTTGKTVHRITLEAAARALLRFGPNTFELTAYKEPSPATTCGAGVPDFGVFAELWGRYVSDVSVTESILPGGCCWYAYTIKNHGPSVVRRGETFGWTISTTKLDPKYEFGVTESSDPEGSFVDPSGFHGCTHAMTEVAGYGLDCSLTRPMYAGQTIIEKILFPYGPLPRGPFIDHWRTTWRFFGWNDPTPKDNYGSAAHGACRPASSCQR